LAKTFLDNFTAVSVYPELGGIANECLQKNVSLYQEIFKSKATYSKVIDNYAVDYTPKRKYPLEEIFKDKQSNEIDNAMNDKKEPSVVNDGRNEKVFNDGALFAEDSVNKSAPIKAQPTLDTTTISKGKK
jgi:hypothetical protein